MLLTPREAYMTNGNGVKSPDLKTILVSAANTAGTLARVVGLIAGKSVNIEGLCVAQYDCHDHDGNHRCASIPIVMDATDADVSVFCNNMQRCLDVHSAVPMETHRDALVLYVVVGRVYSNNPHVLARAKSLAESMGASICKGPQDSWNFVTLHMIAEKDRADRFAELILGMKYRTVVRCGPIVMA